MSPCWFTGSGESISLKEIFQNIDEYAARGGKIFIGTDSQLKNEACVFATAICLHGAKGEGGGKYFVKRFSDTCNSNSVLRLRMMKEVQHSVDIGLRVLERNQDAEIELHIDVGSSPRSKTRGYVDYLKGWATAVGFPCKIKPNAWASASVADKHTK